jgi:hypothetical protein
MELQVYKDGVCHWWNSELQRKNDIEDKVFLVSFDLSNETFVETFIPSKMNYTDSPEMYFNTLHLDMLNGSIGLISYYEEASNFHISILGEVGIKESWIKLFIVGPLSCVEHLIEIGKNIVTWFAIRFGTWYEFGYEVRNL